MEALNATQVVDRDRAWSECLDRLGLDPLALVPQTQYDPWRRTYITNGRVYKLSLRRAGAAPPSRAQTLRGEYEILKRCEKISGIPRALAYHDEGAFEALVLEQIPGDSLAKKPVSLAQELRVVLRLARIGLSAARRGISHNDMRAENVLLSEEGTVSLIDFDQATISSPVTAFLRTFTGLPKAGAAVYGYLLTMPKTRLRKRLPRGVLAAVRWLLRKADAGDAQPLPTLAAHASPRSRELLKAWELAQRSDASAPGTTLAYYSLEVDGYHFPGERPWSERWDLFRELTDYQGKRVLELGCNMALLSCHLLRDMGAADAMAVDVDGRILRAARHVSDAFGVRAMLLQQDLDAPEPWEERLGGFKPDMVFALSVLNWVRDKDRLMRFLGRFPEVIFEGHDIVAAEVERFRNVGFSSVELAGVSERGRGILHCRKRV